MVLEKADVVMCYFDKEISMIWHMLQDKKRNLDVFVLGGKNV